MPRGLTGHPGAKARAAYPLVWQARVVSYGMRGLGAVRLALEVAAQGGDEVGFGHRAVVTDAGKLEELVQPGLVAEGPAALSDDALDLLQWGFHGSVGAVRGDARPAGGLRAEPAVPVLGPTGCSSARG